MLAFANQVQLILPVVQSVFRMVTGVAAIVMFGINYAKKRDAESLGWCLLCILWTL
jgi:hypothetical protein